LEPGELLGSLLHNLSLVCGRRHGYLSICTLQTATVRHLSGSL
jgi:hypothetical protein